MGSSYFFLYSFRFTLEIFIVIITIFWDKVSFFWGLFFTLFFMAHSLAQIQKIKNKNKFRLFAVFVRFIILQLAFSFLSQWVCTCWAHFDHFLLTWCLQPVSVIATEAIVRMRSSYVIYFVSVHTVQTGAQLKRTLLSCTRSHSKMLIADLRDTKFSALLFFPPYSWLPALACLKMSGQNPRREE